jgi:hypothetical protein
LDNPAGAGAGAQIPNGVDFVQSVLKYWRNALLTAGFSCEEEPQVTAPKSVLPAW